MSSFKLYIINLSIPCNTCKLCDVLSNVFSITRRLLSASVMIKLNITVI
jgi:hypothetical protein